LSKTEEVRKILSGKKGEEKRVPFWKSV